MPASDKGRPRVAYCAHCNRVFEVEGDLSALQPGLPFRCEGGERHLAAIVTGNTGKRWLRLRRHLLTYEQSWSPAAQLRRLAPDSFEDSGPYLVARFALLLLSLFVATSDGIIWRFFAVIGSLIFVVDILLTHISIAFVSRLPADALRSVAFALFSFIQLAVGFAVFFAALGPSFVPVDITPKVPVRIGYFDSMYFSLLIMTTVGWGDLMPDPQSAIPKFLISLQLLASLSFLAIALQIMVSWSSQHPTENAKTLKELTGSQP